MGQLLPIDLPFRKYIKNDVRSRCLFDVPVNNYGNVVTSDNLSTLFLDKFRPNRLTNT